MRILLITKVFYPGMGGMEKYAFMIANTLQRMGHDVVVLTEEHRKSNDSYSFKLIRSTNILKDAFYNVKKADACVISGFSLKYILFSLFCKRTILVYHNDNFGSNWQSHIKQLIAKLSLPNIINVTVSNYVAMSLGLRRYKTVYNSYEDDLFRICNLPCERTGFVFVGRICADKGVELLLRAYLELQKSHPNNQDLKLDIIGDGPQKAELESLVKKEYPNSNINFKGILTGETLVKELNSHKFQVVPSVCGEAFGIVALEGMASGCIEICSDSDGLQEAIGNNGFLFKKGSVVDLVTRMEDVLKLSERERKELQDKGLNWVKNFASQTVCENYLKILQ